MPRRIITAVAVLFGLLVVGKGQTAENEVEQDIREATVKRELVIVKSWSSPAVPTTILTSSVR